MQRTFFPIDRVPPQVRAAILSIEGQTDAPTALVASSVLSAISFATQSAYDIQRHDGLISPLALYFLSLAGSGDRKTSADNKALEPIRDFQNQQPTKNRFVFSDITPYALITKLHNCCRSAALFENEAGRLFESRLMEDIGLLNKLWDGKSLSVDRHKQSIEIDSPRCTASLMIQPNIFRDVIRKTGGRLNDYGFLARCLICEPQSKIGQRPLIDGKKIDASDFDDYYAKIQNMLADQAEFFSPGSNKLKTPRKIIKLDSYAQKAWISIYNDIESNSGPNGIYCEHTAYASKMAENIARLAGVLHIYEYPGANAISEGIINSAADIIFWYADEYMRLFSDHGSYDQIAEDARKLESFLIRMFHDKHRTFYKKSDLLHFGPNSLRKAERLDAAISHLHQQAIISIHQDIKHNAAQRISKTACIALAGVNHQVFNQQPQFIHASLAPPTKTFKPSSGY